METCIYKLEFEAETIYKSLLADKNELINLKYDSETKILIIKIKTNDSNLLIKTIKHFNEKLSLCYKTISFINKN